MQEVKSWKLPGFRILTRIWRHGERLVVAGSDSAAVVELDREPLEAHLWEIPYLSGLEPLPGSGWAVISRTGSQRDDIRFPLWFHQGAEPHQGQRGPQGGFWGDGARHVHEMASWRGRLLGVAHYWEEGADHRVVVEHHEGAWRRVEGLASSGQLSCFDVARCGDGHSLLLWGGDLWDELAPGRWEKVAALGLEFLEERNTVPIQGEPGFYLLSHTGDILRVLRGQAPEVCLEGTRLRSLAPGPEGSLVGAAVSNKAGVALRLLWPQEGRAVNVKRRDLGRLQHWESPEAVVYSQASGLLFFYTGLLWTIPQALPLGKRRLKYRPLA